MVEGGGHELVGFGEDFGDLLWGEGGGWCPGVDVLGEEGFAGPEGSDAGEVALVE